MVVGKYLSLEEARRKGLIDRFCDEQPSKGERNVFTDLLDAMAKKPESGGQTSSREHLDED